MKNAIDQLRHFTGTSQWYRHPLTGKLYTDGVKAMAEKYQAYWLIDLVFSHQLSPKLQQQPFQTWTLQHINGCKFLAAATDGNHNIIAKQVIPFSDFEADILELYFSDDVLLLPSEY